MGRGGDRAIASARATLHRAAGGDPVALAEVPASLDETRVLTPLRGADGGPAPPAALPESCPTSWPALVGPSATELALPVFTGPDTLATFRSRTRAIGVDLDAALRLARPCGAEAVVVDPGAAHAVLLAATGGPREEASPAPPFWSANHPVRALSGPLPEPDLAAIRRVVAGAAIDRAWAVELVDPNGLLHLVVAVEPVGPARAVVTDLADRLRDQLVHPDHVRVDVLALTDPTLHDEVAQLDRPIHPWSPGRAGRVVAAQPIRR